MAKGKKMGPYKGQGSIGSKTCDATRKKMRSLSKANLERVGGGYDEHKKAVATKDSSILKRNRVKSYRQP